MGEVTEVRAPVENVNDETVSIVRWLVENGSLVEEGTPLVLAETTKTSFDVESPVRGFVWQVAEAGGEVPIGAVLCYVGDDLERTRATAGADGVGKATAQVAKQEVDAPAGGAVSGAQQPEPPPVDWSRAEASFSTRFSAKAKALVQKLGVDPAVFLGRGVVREDDVLAYTESRSAVDTRPRAGPPRAPSLQRARMSPALGVPTRIEALSRSKRYEGRQLRAAHASTLPSAVTVSVPTHGFLSVSHDNPGLVGFAAAAVIYETARLLRAYPMFNAFHADDEIHYYEQVNIGYAIDLGNGLKVPVLRDADSKSLAAIVEEKQRLLVDYLADSLTVEALAGGTFTMTDLSGEGVAHIHPVINNGQSAVLGLCAELLPPGGGAGAFNLVLAFDHQVADGRTAAAFLRELRDRLIAHETSLTVRREQVAAEPRCALCLRPAGELEDARHFLVRTVPRAGRAEQTVCTICLEAW